MVVSELASHCIYADNLSVCYRSLEIEKMLGVDAMFITWLLR